jgi:hypothetical protein
MAGSISPRWTATAVAIASALLVSGKELFPEILSRSLAVVLLDFDLKPGRDDTNADFTLAPDVRVTILANYSLLAVLPTPQPEKADTNEGRFFVWVSRVDVRAVGDSVRGVP